MQCHCVWAYVEDIEINIKMFLMIPDHVLMISYKN